MRTFAYKTILASLVVAGAILMAGASKASAQLIAPVYPPYPVGYVAPVAPFYPPVYPGYYVGVRSYWGPGAYYGYGYGRPLGWGVARPWGPRYYRGFGPYMYGPRFY